jgi:hypothetical protein
MLRIMQYVSFCLIAFAFLCRIPSVFDTYEESHQRLLQVLGLEALVANG